MRKLSNIHKDVSGFRVDGFESERTNYLTCLKVSKL